MILWTNDSASEATGGKAGGSWQASRVEIDSRRIRPGDLFVAIKGERFDGHDYVNDAFARGAVAAVVSSSIKGEGNFLQVTDTQHALEALGHYARKRSSANIIGVTGSVGKTSAKEMIRLALAAHGKTFATSGNFNNHIGTPLSLANLPPDADFAVFEMGMNHAGEIAGLTAQVRPHIAVITNIEAVHLEFFDSIEGIADAKAEIFSGMEQGGIAILNADNAQYQRLQSAAQKRGLSVISCGKQGDYRILYVRSEDMGMRIEYDIAGKKHAVRLNVIGGHWAMTALFALAVTHDLKLDMHITIAALAAFQEPEGRGRLLQLAGGAILIDDSYNASPASMRAAFAKTAEVSGARGNKGRKLAALGDMRELGQGAPALHTELAADITRHGFDQVFTAGELMRHLHEALPEAVRAAHVARAEDLLPHLTRALKPDDILLVKGSHGSHMYKLAALLQEGEKKHAV